jgi:hypothetical protein
MAIGKGVGGNLFAPNSSLGEQIKSAYIPSMVTNLFAPNSSLGEQIKSAYMPSWALLGMTAVKGKVRKRNNKAINKN